MKEILKEEIEKFWKENGPMTHAEYDRLAKCARYFYDLRAAQIKEAAQELVDKGERCMDQSEDDAEAYAWWDGFHNCAQGIMRELEEEREDKKTTKIKAWVARCENGDLHCFISNDFRKPIRDAENPGDGYWRFDPPGIFTIQNLDPGLYSDLKWEDEPIEVELLIHRP